MKKTLIITLVAVVACGAGYGVSAQAGVFNHSSTSKKSASSSSSEKAAKSSQSKEQGSKSMATSTTDLTQSNQKNTDNQATSVTYYYHGINVPASVTLNNIDGQNPQVVITYQDGSNRTFDATVSSANFKDIRIYGQSGNTVRTVKATKQIKLGNQTGGPAAGFNMSGLDFYFFSGSKGTSLASPNFAGNYNQGQADVMLELIQN